MIGRSPWVGGALLVVALAVSAARPAEADARRDYLDGLLAFREGRLAAAVAALERAAAERPKEEARARLVGAIPEPYLPWHFLGLALAKQGRCDEALKALERSAADGAAARFPERLQELDSARLACLPAPTPEPVPIASVPAPEPEEQAPEEGQPGKVPGTLPVPEVAPEQVPGTSTSTSSNPALPRSLEEAGDRFAEGDYRGTLSALERMPRPPGPARPARERALADLLSAAAYFSLHELAGGSDSDLLEQATAAARRARSAAPDLRPETTVFSPRYVDWFDSLR